MTCLFVVLGDQLSPGLLAADDPADTVVLMMEVAAEATYVRHHQKKIAFLFSAMRHFAEDLRGAGWTVDYVRLDESDNSGDFDGEVVRAARRHGATRIVTTEGGEWRVLAAQQGWGALTGLPCVVRPDDRFLIARAEFADWAEGRKRLVMEDFYRVMRRRTGLLMNGAEPAGGAWNFDADNRKTPAKGLAYPPVPGFAPDAVTAEVLDLVGARFGNHFGDLLPFAHAVTRAQALDCLADFIDERLPRFGDYQDAMVAGQDHLFHSQLSPLINCGLLLPMEVCAAADAAYRAGDVPINAAEGFIRQILGWREYVRGIHWIAGPDYTARNHLAATRDLPEFYWTGDTGMRCLAEAVGATKRHAHAHHIQRLMVLGNFAMLTGVDPFQVHEWFLAVYDDAYEWVETPNVIGMSQFADGGLMGSKPYAAGGAYINRMSDYCRGCRYNVKLRTGPEACPFNSLYWDFLARHRDRLKGNQRLWRMYDGWDRFDADEQAAIRAQAADFMATL
ncbi:cryptochrome/photolyase family protein [Polymorphobacter fuscus]|uniref:Cryptochrome/photolyase family protein n=1 Tax=Sandarakinorhabdus fusca TaxID=1439888 RepID=A0A7C9GV30_9SPHN|nr:cryptochrome/photolyase family protein [Polymorphobacter fuscus]KAB7647752.1 cryptochrome/photolyase family protein [Polymorphobacter fuscus]MQT17049.1 cryptochrome/photolyase family protein [Polymorphobacter fuscus]NJC08959.1 deoxyribodipyrimidine photolyase-related protein [Polymorphobacter fuscus]